MKDSIFIMNPFRNLQKQSNKKYDVIICNPPFFENDLKSENQKRNLALHGEALSLEELISIVDILLKEDGSFFIYCLIIAQNILKNY